MWYALAGLAFVYGMFKLFSSVGWGWPIFITMLAFGVFQIGPFLNARINARSREQEEEAARVRREQEEAYMNKFNSIKAKVLEGCSVWADDELDILDDVIINIQNDLDKREREILIDEHSGSEIWIGQTEDELLLCKGRPDERRNKKESANLLQEEFCYGRVGKNRYTTKVIVKNGIVSSIKD